ncbi:MAG TPA: hypothetical protein VG605_11555 [Puia sp.]|nr:hypothetical protein [Puia sp.]
MKRSVLLFGKKGFGALAALFFLLPMPGYAGNVTVSNTSQFVSALSTADAASTSTTITMNAGTYSLSSSLIFGSHDNVTLTIVASGAVVIQAPSGDRIIILNDDGTRQNLSVSITGVTFENGRANDNFGGGAILCGGPGNSYTFTNCVFTNNASQVSAGNTNGGAVNMSGGGAFTFTNCTFTNNSVPDGNGGALTFFQQNIASSLAVTGCTFNGNSAATSETFTPVGGAIWISAEPGGLSSSVSITKNTFINNTDAQGQGGAIEILNGATTPTAFINYNRFYQNTAGQFADVAMGAASGGGDVDISNNWWGSNVSPVSGGTPLAGITGTGGSGSLVATPFLELTCSGSAASLCGGSAGNSTTVTASFVKNSAGTSIPVGNLSALVGLPVSFSSTEGALSGAQLTIQSGGTATATFTDNGTAGSDDVHAVVDGVPNTDAVADAHITVNAPASLASSAASGTVTAGSSTPAVTDGSCNAICLITPGGASPLSGSVTARVTIDGSLQSDAGQPYLTRHYDIEPVAGAATATATITLYFLQGEFDLYNASVSDPSQKLPTAATDMTGRGNLTITQFHGTGTAPGSYTGWTGTGPASVLITPGASNVVWNSAKSWWEVSFSVTGFSGFYVTGPMAFPLPVVLEGFGGLKSGSGVLLNWKVAEESGLARYEVQRSDDGVGFSTVGEVVASGAASGSGTVSGSGAGGSSSGAEGSSSGAAAGGAGSYRFFDGAPVAGKNFYRLRMVNMDGSFTYSQVIVVDVTAEEGGQWVRAQRNPWSGACSVVVTAEAGGQVSMRLADVSGKALWHGDWTLGAGANTLLLPQTATLAPGIYFLSVLGRQGMQTIKLVKE